MRKSTLNFKAWTVFLLQNKVYPRLEVLRNENADIRVLIVTVCEWSGVKIYDVVVLKSNLALIFVTGNGDEWLRFRVCHGTDCRLAIVMVKRYLLRWDRKFIVHMRVSADERKPHAGKALDNAEELLSSKNSSCSNGVIGLYNNSPFLQVHF